MELLLGLKERLVFSSIIPEKGDLLTQRAAKDMLERIEPTQDELSAPELKFRVVHLGGNQSYKWDEKNEKKKKYKFNELEGSILKKEVQKLHGSEEISLNMVSLCELVCPALSKE